MERCDKKELTVSVSFLLNPKVGTIRFTANTVRDENMTDEESSCFQE